MLWAVAVVQRSSRSRGRVSPAKQAVHGNLHPRSAAALHQSKLELSQAYLIKRVLSGRCSFLKKNLPFSKIFPIYIRESHI